ncbi:type II toxin-antitoxin system RelE/ParE family toxin [Serratia marcescens]
MTDIYLTKAFQTFAGDERISDATIVKAAREMQNQLYDANLGGCVYKKRIAGWGAENGAGIGS